MIEYKSNHLKKLTELTKREIEIFSKYEPFIAYQSGLDCMNCSSCQQCGSCYGCGGCGTCIGCAE